MPAISEDIRKALWTLSLALLLTCALLWALGALTPQLSPAPATGQLSAPQPRQILERTGAREMARALEQAGVVWPPAGTTIPAVIASGLPRDMDTLEAGERSALFLRLVLVPAVLANYRIQHERRYLQAITRHGLPPADTPAHARLQSLARRYDIAQSLRDPGVIDTLSRRIDQVPAALVLAVAALESSWGLSRFAVESNALFGQWSGRIGQLPRQFEHPAASVRHFMHTLNTHPAFAQWRAERQQGASLAVLTEALAPWSPERESYTSDLQRLVRAHALDRLPRLRPAPGTYD